MVLVRYRCKSPNFLVIRSLLTSLLQATTVMSFICGFSILPFRAYAYEFFLFIHIGFSVMTLIFLFL